MKYLFCIFAMVVLLSGCATTMRSEGEAYPGYSCRESLSHFYSRCSAEKLTQEEFETKVQFCEKELATKICDKEQAGLLWCMGRVEPGTYSSSRGIFVRGFYFGINRKDVDGCSCSAWDDDLKKCRMQKGIFD